MSIMARKRKADEGVEKKPRRKKKKGSVGAPRQYDREKCTRKILALIAEGQALTRICRENVKLPAASTFIDWTLEDEKIGERYAAACKTRAELMAFEIFEIADDGSNDTYIDPETGQERTNHDVVQRSRLRVDTRKWYLSKVLPKFADRSQQSIVTKEFDPNDYDEGELEQIANGADPIAILAKRKRAPTNEEG